MNRRNPFNRFFRNFFMTDFFRDVSLQARGVDLDAVHEEDKKIKEETKNERVFLPFTFKRMVYIFGGIYLVGGIAGTLAIKSIAGMTGTAWVLLVLSMIDIAAIIAMLLKTKRSEIIGLALVIGFFVTLFIYLGLS